MQKQTTKCATCGCPLAAGHRFCSTTCEREHKGQAMDAWGYSRADIAEKAEREYPGERYEALRPLLTGLWADVVMRTATGERVARRLFFQPMATRKTAKQRLEK